MYMTFKTAVDRVKRQNRNRQAYNKLFAMDDALLRDIGTHRGEIHARVYGTAR